MSAPLPLSKDYLRDVSGREKVYVHEAAFYEDQRDRAAHWTMVDAIDPDADALRKRLEAGARVAVIGAGWIGAGSLPRPVDADAM